MPTPDRHDGWRKSSYSDTANGCVELFRTLGAVRDSKNPEGPQLAVGAQAMVRWVKTQ